jgi:hypothetical protein
MSSSRDNATDLSFADPIELLLKPTFLPGKTLPEVIYEAREVVLLRFIEKMDQESLGLSTPHLVMKFKALLQILTHEYFIQKQEWALQEHAYTEKFIKTQSQIMSEVIYKVLHPVRHDLEAILNEDAKQARIKNIVDDSCKQYVVSIKKYFKLRNDIYAGNFSFDETLFNITIDKISAELTPADNTEVIFTRVFTILNTFAKQTEFVSAKALFNEFNFAKLQDEVIHANYNKATLLGEAADLQDIHASYLDFLNYFIRYLNEILSQIKKLFPHFRVKLFDELFKKAFEKMFNDETCYWNNFFIELNLQQIRKPELSDDIQEFLQTIFVPILQASHIDIEKHLLSKVLKATSNGAQHVPSLQQMLNDSYSQLFSTLNTEPVLSTSYLDLPEEKLVYVEDVTPILSPYLATLEESSRLLPLTDGHIIPPLFAVGSIPGVITSMDISILNQVNKHVEEYQTNYEEFSKLPMNSSQHHDRVVALEQYRDDYLVADSLEKKAALLDVAKPYINRHEHFDIDKILGKTNTSTWSRILKKARQDALTSLKVQVMPLDDERAVAALKCWRQIGIFSQHRSNFKILGAFGRTHAQKEIDTLITERQNKLR